MRRPSQGRPSSGGERLIRVRFDWRYATTLTAMAGLVVAVIGCALAGIDPDIGVFALAFGAVLTLLDPAAGSLAVSRSTGPPCSWSAASSPSWACCRRWARSTCSAKRPSSRHADGRRAGHLRRQRPDLGVRLDHRHPGGAGAADAAAGRCGRRCAGWALISRWVCAPSIVDCSPFSTTGATLVASAAAEDRPRLQRVLLRWGMAMVVVGPAAMVGLLVFPSTPGPAGP